MVLLRSAAVLSPGRRPARPAAPAVPAGAGRPARLRRAVLPVDLVGGRGRRDPVPGRARRAHRAGQPGRPGAGDQRRVHPGAGRRGRPAGTVRGAGVRAAGGARADGRRAGADRTPRRAGRAAGRRLPVPAPHAWPRRCPWRSGRERARRRRDRRRPGRAARGRAAVRPRPGRAHCWRRRTGRAGGWPPTRSTASAATAASRCSTPPTRRCGSPPTWTGWPLRSFESGAAVRGADGRLHVFAHPVRRPGLIWRTAADELLPAAGQGHAGRVDGAGAGQRPRPGPPSGSTARPRRTSPRPG